MSWLEQPHSRRKALSTASSLVVGAALPGTAAAQAAAHTAAPDSSAAASYTNPVLWQDFADIDIIRVGNAYYYSASTMHYSPGAPILRSYDLVNWEFAATRYRCWTSGPSTT